VKLRKTIKEADRRPIVPPKGFVDYVALVWATGLLSGYSPIAPGTAGSAVMAVMYYAGIRLHLFNPFDAKSFLPLLVASFLVSYTGTWASTKAISFFGNKDPNEVVVDEFAGQLVTYLFLPLIPQFARIPYAIELWTVIGFFVFRTFDVFKPYPARDFENLKGGLGIMADDVVAGIQGALVMIVGGTLAVMLFP
jgi:phosphatidylglycerophosphatase A